MYRCERLDIYFEWGQKNICPSRFGAADHALSDDGGNGGDDGDDGDG